MESLEVFSAAVLGITYLPVTLLSQLRNGQNHDYFQGCCGNRINYSMAWSSKRHLKIIPLIPTTLDMSPPISFSVEMFASDKKRPLIFSTFSPTPTAGPPCDPITAVTAYWARQCAQPEHTCPPLTLSFCISPVPSLSLVPLTNEHEECPGESGWGDSHPGSASNNRGDQRTRMSPESHLTHLVGEVSNTCPVPKRTAVSTSRMKHESSWKKLRIIMERNGQALITCKGPSFKNCLQVQMELNRQGWGQGLTTNIIKKKDNGMLQLTKVLQQSGKRDMGELELNHLGFAD